MLQSRRHYLSILAMFLFMVIIGGCGGSTPPLPNAPTGLTISSTVSKNMLNWNAVSGCVYNIYRGTASGTEIAIAGSFTTTFTDTPPVTPATPYYYVVTAINTNGESGGSNEVSVTPPALAIGAVTSASVAFSWTMPASASGITSYNIYRSLTSGSEGLPALASSTTASYSDTTVVHGTTYYYRVTALGPNGESLGSNEISASP